MKKGRKAPLLFKEGQGWLLRYLIKSLSLETPTPELGEGRGGVNQEPDNCHLGIKRFLLFSKLFFCTFVAKLLNVLLKEVIYLVQKDFILEWRQKYAFNGMLLYVGSTVFICYLSFSMRFSGLQVPVWNALYWIILLFTAVNAISKSFTQENRGRLLYFYSLVSPQGVILAKIAYNAALMLVLALLCFFFYAVIIGNPVQDIPMFLVSILLGALGFATSLTLVSGIAAKAANSSALMAVLSFPVIAPMLLMLMKLSKNAIDGLDRSANLDELGVLAAINVIVIATSYILFPFLWRT